ncbi:MAG TPA: type 1 glutamine amidotransferase [Acidimicrobiales bacterium]|nr:type 1 glutamine amidotransferase [Acidimicrobiales bacterium]
MRRAIALQHIACEPPGVFAEVLSERRIALDAVELDEGDALPDWHDADLVIAMGGPMSVNDESSHAFLGPEKRWIAAAVGAGVPYFGVCLGSQLLAASLGATVRTGERPEVGVLPVELTPEGRADTVFSGLGDDFPVLQWHGDTFDLPKGAVHLGRSTAYANQAFRVGDSAYAVQFHLEVTAAMLEEWSRVPAYVASLSATLGPGGFDVLAAQCETNRSVMEAAAKGLFRRFLDATAERGEGSE